jgi:hypothetical protein
MIRINIYKNNRGNSLIPKTKIKRWSKNTVNGHKRRGLELHATPQIIYEEAIKTITKHDGCCPDCGKPFSYDNPNQIVGNHWISLEYIDPDCFEIICRDCNLKRNIMDQRKGFNYLNSK